MQGGRRCLRRRKGRRVPSVAWPCELPGVCSAGAAGVVVSQEGVEVRHYGVCEVGVSDDVTYWTHHVGHQVGVKGITVRR